jgi:hypothetical protein
MLTVISGFFRDTPLHGPGNQLFQGRQVHGRKLHHLINTLGWARKRRGYYRNGAEQSSTRLDKNGLHELHFPLCLFFPFPSVLLSKDSVKLWKLQKSCYNDSAGDGVGLTGLIHNDIGESKLGLYSSSSRGNMSSGIAAISSAHCFNMADVGAEGMVGRMRGENRGSGLLSL